MNRRDWLPTVWPHDEEAAAALRSWLDNDEDTFVGLDLDFSGADLTGVYWHDAWLCSANFTRTVLRDSELGYAHIDRADFSQADLDNTNLADASGTETILRDATLRNANFGPSRFWRADLTGADLTGADLGDASFSASTLVNVDFTGATADKTVLGNVVLDSATVTGFTGHVIGPISVTVDSRPVLLDDAELETWFAARGASITRFRADRDPH